jgi:hypothetical protein
MNVPGMPLWFFKTYLKYWLLLIHSNCTFFFARFIAEEVLNSSIIETSNITKDWAPIPLPQNRDELYVLSKTINNLLDRIENTIERENSRLMLHMKRTPLTIKRNFRGFNRKPRNSSEYEEKSTFVFMK